MRVIDLYNDHTIRLSKIISKFNNVFIFISFQIISIIYYKNLH
jgi:hypothetical protein